MIVVLLLLPYEKGYLEMKEILTKYKYFLILGLCFLIGFTLYYRTMTPKESVNELAINVEQLKKKEFSDRTIEEASIVTPPEKVEISTVVVDVKGAVVNPGVYELKNGSRVQDALIQAGGVDSDGEVKHVNLAALLVDEMVIYVPKIGEEISQTHQLQEVTSDSNDQLISINKATSEELQTLPGIGPSKATAIIEYREQNGGFKHIDELLSISGIGSKTLEKFRDKITIK